MKNPYSLIASAIFLVSINCASSQSTSTGTESLSTMKSEKQSIGMVISSNDPETVWNAFRLANYSIEQGDSVSVFLLGKGVESSTITSEVFDVKEMMELFSENGGIILACGTCLQIRKQKGTELCPVSSLSDLYQIIKTKDVILNF